MNQYILKYIIVALLVLHCSNLLSQTDSTNISYSVENADSSNFNYRRQYQYVDFAQITERNLLKFGVSALKANNQFYLGYERKFTEAWSAFWEFAMEDFQGPRANIGGKYFFLKKNLIRKGLSGNNLNGVYLGGQIELFYFANKENPNFIPAKITIGVQKRLTWFSYIDVNLFAGSVDTRFENYGYMIGLNGKLGLAWGWGNK